MAAASGALLAALAPHASASPNCSGDGTANTCVIDITNVATEQVDASTQPAATNDVVQFVGTLSISGEIFGTALANPIGDVRLANFEIAQVMAGADLTVTGTTADTIFNQVWQIDAGGILRARGGNAIGDGSSVTVNGTLEVGGGAAPASQFDETIGILSGSGLVSILNGKTFHAGGAATTFSGDISGAGAGFDKVGTGMLTLTGNSTYTGLTTVTAGVLVIANAAAIDQSSGVTTVNGGVLAGTVDYAINGPVTNAGSVSGNVTINGPVTSTGGFLPGHMSLDPNGNQNPGQSMGTITINNNYTSNSANAYVGMFIDLDLAVPAGGTPGTTHDFFDVTGNVAGTTKLFVVDFDTAVDTAGATTGNGIQVIRVGGTTTPGAFVQGNSLTSGAYQYLLNYVPDYSGVPGTADGYFLQSAVRDELVAQPAMLSASQQLIRGCFRDDQRVPDSPKGATYGRAWVGYHQGATEFGADTGIELDLDYSCTSGGMDWRMGYGWFGGVSGGFGSANGDLATPAGTADLDASARVIEAYASFTSSSFFINLSAGYADTDWDVTDAFSGVAQTSVSGFIAQAQAGLALDLEIVAVKLIGAVNYDGQNCGDSCFGLAVTEDTGIIEGKGTVRFDGVTWGGSIRPWAAVSYSDVLSDGINTVSMDLVTVSSATNDELLSLDAGLQTYLDENLSLFVDGGYHESLSKDITGYKAGVGLKLYW